MNILILNRYSTIPIFYIHVTIFISILPYLYYISMIYTILYNIDKIKDKIPHWLIVRYIRSSSEGYG